MPLLATRCVAPPPGECSSASGPPSVRDLRKSSRMRKAVGADDWRWRRGPEPARLGPCAAEPGHTQAVAAALAEATNAHDIDAFVSLFAPDYDSQQPAHPDRAFLGRDQVRANWSAVFAGVPDFRAELVATAVEADTSGVNGVGAARTRTEVAWTWRA